jgi:serine O-acetyltransferase
VHLRPGTTCDSHPGAQGGAGGWPSIGHGVDVGAGARIVGDISIGDGASVGANSLVLESVPPACAVLGVPGRLLPRRTSVRAEESSTEAVESTPGLGVSDQNPAGIGLLSLIAEDFRTNGSSLWAPGFWTLFFHRFGNYRMRFRFKVLRAPMTAIYLAGFVIVRLLTGIDLSYVVKVGRRVRFDRNGPMMIGAESLGDDVFLGHSVVIGVASRKKVQKKPVIGDRVVIGPRACIVGGVRIGSDSVIGANTVVPASVPPGSLVIGVPGRVMARAGNFAGTESRVQSNGPAILQSHQ